MRGWFIGTVLVGVLAVACTSSPEPMPVDLGFDVPDAWQAGDSSDEPVRRDWWNALGDEGLARAV